MCCMVALSPFTLNNSISLALNLCILTWTTAHGLNVISATPHSTYNVYAWGVIGPLSKNKRFLCTFFLLQRILGLHVDPCRLITLRPVLLPRSFWHLLRLHLKIHVVDLLLCPLVLKMAQKRLCPDDGTPAKKTKEATQILCQEDTDHGKIKRHGSLWRLGTQKQEDRALHSGGYD